MPSVRRPSLASIAAAVAVVVALTGSGVAVGGALAKNSVGSKQIKNNAVTGKDIKEKSLKTVPSAKSAVDSGDILRATIDENGALLPEASEGAVSAQVYGGGTVVGVIFNRSVTTCSVIATGYSTQATTFGRFAEASSGPAAPKAVVARTVDRATGDSYPGPLSIVVVC